MRKRKLTSLTIGYSSLDSRVKNIKLPDLSQHPDWDVVLTVQSGSAKEPNLSGAPKIDQILTFTGQGVTKLRNQVLQNAKGKYLVFGDDDVTFNVAGLAKAIEHMEQSGSALILTQAVDESGQLRKAYPTKVTKLTKFNSAKAATYEMVINVEKVKNSKVAFDESFGAGAKTTYLGDEYIFICDLISAGETCEFIPISIAAHPTDSSGSGWGSNEDRIARALIFDRAFKGTTALPYLVRIAFGLKKLGKELSLKNYLKFIFKR